MKKFFSIMLSLTMIATVLFSNVIYVSAADLHPQFSAEITDGTGDYEGYMVISGYITTDKNLDYAKTQNAPPKFGGSYILTLTAAIKINAPYFEIASAADYNFFNEEFKPCADTVQKFAVLDSGTRAKYVINDGKTYGSDKKLKLFEFLAWPKDGYTKEQIMASEDWYTLTEFLTTIETFNSDKSTSTDFTSEAYNMIAGQEKYDIVTPTTNTPALSVAEGVQSTTTNANDTITWAVTAPVASINAGLTAKIESGTGESMTKPLGVDDAFKAHYTGTGFAAFNLILNSIDDTTKNATTKLSILKTADSSVLGTATVK